MTENRISLACLPTPIQDLPKLGRALFIPQLFIKRDDLTGLGPGGNKTRKLEYLCADALKQGAKRLFSCGAIQSNHCRQVAAAANRLGLACTLILAGEAPAKEQGNLLLDRLSGAQILFCPKEERDACLEEAFNKALAEGQKPYLIPYGGSNAIGALAYREALREIMAQDAPFDWIVFASSSGGTQAGLVLGAREFNFRGRILGISIELPAEQLATRVSALANEAAALLGQQGGFCAEDVLVNDDFCHAGYGVLTAQDAQAVRLFSRMEGILLDPVYTGRAAGALIALTTQKYFRKNERILFLHTGGIPALFAEPYCRQLNIP